MTTEIKDRLVAIAKLAGFWTNIMLVNYREDINYYYIILKVKTCSCGASRTDTYKVLKSNFNTKTNEQLVTLQLFIKV